MTTGPVLSLEGFGVGFRDRVVLAQVTLDVPMTGVQVLMGPAGGGKSTLLRTLSGLNQTQPDLRHWGSALYQGERLDPTNRPAIVQQDVRHFVATVRENLVSSFPDRHRLQRRQQDARLETLISESGVPELSDHLDDEAIGLPQPLRRLLAVLRAMATGAALVCLDETTAGMDEAWAARVLDLVRWYAREHAVLFVTHHQVHARAVADRLALLGGGRVVEEGPATGWWQNPRTAELKRFLETGSVSLPAPDADPATLAEDVPPPPPLPAAARAVSEAVGPRGFRWLLPGRLGGLPRPGIVASLEQDLDGLRRLGVSVLVTLEETATVATAELEARGLSGIHFPVVDMEAPGAVETASLCARLQRALDSGDVVAFHCRAGQGRTGTLLACLRIWQGASAVDALDQVRSVNPKWVTSDAQVRFLEIFFDFVRWQSGHATGPQPPPPASPQ